MKPQAKRPVIEYLKTTYAFSERRACSLLALTRSSYRYRSQPKDDTQLTTRLNELATKYPVYGYLMLHGLLKQEGLVVNRKRTYRLYTAANLQARTKQRKKLQCVRQPMLLPSTINKRWSMDFVADQLSDGRRFRVLNIVDDYSRECIGQYIDTSISGETVSRVLEWIAQERGLPGLPEAIVCDNGSVLTLTLLFTH